MTPHLQCYGVSLESTGDDSTLSNASPTRPPRPVHHDQCLVRTPPQHIPRPQHSFALARRHHDSRLPNTPYRRPIPPFDSPRPIFCAATCPLLVRFLGMTIHGMHSAENDFGSAIQFFFGTTTGLHLGYTYTDQIFFPFYLPPRPKLCRRVFLTPPPRI